MGLAGWLLLAWALALAGCPDRATKDLVSRRREARMSANQLHNLGLAHLRAGDFEDCVRVYREVLRRKRLAASSANLGYCLRHVEPPRLEEALAAYERAHRWAPASARIRLGRGVTRALVGQREKAEIDHRILRGDASAAASQLRAVLDSGREPREGPRLGVFGPLPTPRQAPLGIMGN